MLKKRWSKAMNASFSIKRNTSEKASRQTKLSVYCGYIDPILTYGSQVLSYNKGDLKKLENVQRRATKWIMSCGDTVSYSSRPATSGILPLSLYTELHDILLLSQIIQEKYNISRANTLTSQMTLAHGVARPTTSISPKIA